MRRLILEQLLRPKLPRLVSVFSQPFAALAFIGVEVAFAPVHVAVALEGQDVGGQAVQEPAIMAHHDGATGKVRHRLFQGSHRWQMAK